MGHSHYAHVSVQMREDTCLSIVIEFIYINDDVTLRVSAPLCMHSV